MFVSQQNNLLCSSCSCLKKSKLNSCHIIHNHNKGRAQYLCPRLYIYIFILTTPSGFALGFGEYICTEQGWYRAMQNNVLNGVTGHVSNMKVTYSALRDVSQSYISLVMFEDLILNVFHQFSKSFLMSLFAQTIKH